MYHATATALLGELESDSDALEVILIIGAHFLSIDLCSVLFCKQKKYCANNCFTRVYAMLKRCTIIYRPCKFWKDFFLSKSFDALTRRKQLRRHDTNLLKGVDDRDKTKNGGTPRKCSQAGKRCSWKVKTKPFLVISSLFASKTSFVGPFWDAEEHTSGLHNFQGR